MPSPVGHAIAGLTVHVLTARDETELLTLRRLGLAVLAGIVPDLDLLLALVDGRNHHQHASHSLGAALLAGCAAAAWHRLRGRARPGALGTLVGLAWLSHVGLDYLNRDATPPIGLMALWPFSESFYKFPWPLFLDISRAPTWEAVRNNLLAAFWEALVLLPLFSLAWHLRLRRLGG